MKYTVYNNLQVSMTNVGDHCLFSKNMKHQISGSHYHILKQGCLVIMSPKVVTHGQIIKYHFNNYRSGAGNTGPNGQPLVYGLFFRNINKNTSYDSLTFSIQYESKKDELVVDPRIKIIISKYFKKYNLRNVWIPKDNENIEKTCHGALSDHFTLPFFNNPFVIRKNRSMIFEIEADSSNSFYIFYVWIAPRKKFNELVDLSLYKLKSEYSKQILCETVKTDISSIHSRLAVFMCNTNKRYFSLNFDLIIELEILEIVVVSSKYVYIIILVCVIVAIIVCIAIFVCYVYYVRDTVCTTKNESINNRILEYEYTDTEPYKNNKDRKKNKNFIKTKKTRKTSKQSNYYNMPELF